MNQGIIKVHWETDNAVEDKKVFYVEEINNVHDHSNKGKIQRMKDHHIAGKFIKQFVPTIWRTNYIPGKYELKIDSSCKTNPGIAAIAYKLTDSEKKVVLENAKVMEGEFTNNQA